LLKRRPYRVSFHWILANLLIFGICSAGETIFSTWEGFEVDKLASIWLIKRFVSPGATVKFYPKGEPIKTGVPFDTPYSKIKRSFNQSTFESLLVHYRLTDGKLLNIGKLVHDIEINLWEKKIFQETGRLQLLFVDLLDGSKTDQAVIDEAMKIFDDLYRTIPDQLERNPK